MQNGLQRFLSPLLVFPGTTFQINQFHSDSCPKEPKLRPFKPSLWSLRTWETLEPGPRDSESSDHFLPLQFHASLSPATENAFQVLLAISEPLQNVVPTAWNVLPPAPHLLR